MTTTVDIYKMRLVDAAGLPQPGVIPSSVLYAGTLSTSGTAAAIAASQAISEVVIQNDPDNTDDILVGNSTAQTIQIKPGNAIVLPVSNLALVYAKSVSGTPTLNYLGRS